MMENVVGTGLLLTAVALGVSHGIEPDHVAGITALTLEAGDPRLSGVVGACFAIEHSLLVVLWIGVAWGLLGVTAFPEVFEQFGLLVVGIILSILGLYLGLSGTRKLVHRHEHIHAARNHVHYHLNLPAWLESAVPQAGDGHDDHGHGIVEYLKIGTVGALFTLSAPVSMIAFISVVMSSASVPELPLVISFYTMAIIATMAAVGGGAGTIFRRLKADGDHLHAMSQVLASIIVLVFAITVLVEAVPLATA